MSRIEDLLKRMTLAEKLGQLTMTASGYAVTGPVIAGDSTQAIKDGSIGSLLNLVGARHVHDMQRLAVEQSRLKIPLLIGFDVIHGHRTVFPIPLGEAASRAHLGLPGRQNELADRVFERARVLHKPVIVVLFSGRPLIVPALVDAADAVLAAWYPGSEAGNAVGDLVLGRVSPSGRTPVSWARATGQVPIFFGQRPGGRPADPADHYTSKYLDVPNDPLFPFGHGLSYGRFTYANLRVPRQAVGETETLVVRVDVSNEGARAAEETVFVFVHDVLASVSRPVLELKGFAKIELQPGESGTVSVLLPVAELRFLGPDLQPTFEPGEVQILVGPCADRRQLLVSSIFLANAR